MLCTVFDRPTLWEALLPPWPLVMPAELAAQSMISWMADCIVERLAVGRSSPSA